jgi:trehalose 6-phosphate synthase/phosphatase
VDVSPLGFREAADRSKPGVVLVSNRLPATATLVGDRVEIVRSVGGVATGLRGVHERGGRAWVGWPGETPTLDRARKKELTDAFRAQGLEPVDLTTREIKRFYEGFANGVLWPLFHYDLDRIPLDARDFDVYRAVNEKFADAVTRRVSPGDSIWIHDYQLMLLPALLRERLPDARIGYFHHVPFPSSEIFRVLPWRERILEGLLGADLVGFHTHAYARHFASAALRVLGLDAEFDVVRRGDRATRIGVFPMGVDVARHAELASDPDVIAESERFRSDGGEKILVGVDRLDYTKGLRRRLLAFGRLLERRPEFRGRVRFIQVAAPSRSKVDAYAKFRRDVNEIVGRVNGAYGAPDFTPLQYAARSFDEREVAALYRAADAVVVTPLRDGMNLVAKEFVAARTDGDGVLILSETAGAAAELGEALIVNPFDVDSMADA